MFIEVDQQFLEESRRYVLRHDCEHCVHFAPEERRCAEGFPNAEHLEIPERPGQHVVFCKSFELY